MIDKVESVSYQSKGYIIDPTKKPAKRGSSWNWVLRSETKTTLERESKKSYQALIRYEVLNPSKKGSETESIDYAYSGESMHLFNRTRMEGYVDYGKERQDMLPLAGPLLGWGHTIMRPAEYMRGISTWEILQRCKIEKIAENRYRFFLINAVDETRKGSMHAELVLAPEYGYAPVRIDLFELNYPDTVVQRFESSEFFEKDGVWLPGVVTMLGYKVGPDGEAFLEPEFKTVTDPKTVTINPVTSDETYVIDFGTEIPYIDFRTGEKFNWGKRPDHVVAVSDDNTWWGWLLLPFFLILVAALWGWRRRSLKIGVMVLFAGLLGCQNESAAPPTTETICLIVQQAQVEKEIEAGRMVHDEESFVVRNVSSSQVRVGKLQMSCGCTSAHLDQEVIEAGESTTVHAKVVLSDFFEGKIIRLSLPVIEPVQPPLEMSITYNAMADWRVEPVSVRVTGVSNGMAEAHFPVRVSAERGPLLLTSSDDGVQLQYERTSDTGGLLRVNKRLPRQAGLHPVSVQVRSNGIPNSLELTLIQEVLPPLLWSPSIIEFAPDRDWHQDVELWQSEDAKDLQLKENGALRYETVSTEENVKRKGCNGNLRLLRLSYDAEADPPTETDASIRDYLIASAKDADGNVTDSRLVALSSAGE